jgi:hypothetical protein
MSGRTDDADGDTTDGSARAAVRRRLDGVIDAEPYESLLELDDIDRLEIDPPRVHVEYTLSTAWCSPALRLDECGRHARRRHVRRRRRAPYGRPLRAPPRRGDNRRG